MPGLKGFSDNPLRSWQDVALAAKAFIQPLSEYRSIGGARIRLPVASGVHFDETAAQLEGFSRPLWAVAALLCAGDADHTLLQPWIDGLCVGVDPKHPEYWGNIEDFDQRMVEVEPICFLLLATPQDIVWAKMSSETQKNVIVWLQSMVGKQMPAANWLWFRVMAMITLIRVCQVDTTEVRAQMKADLHLLDSFYTGDGWSGDGPWRSSKQDEEEWRVYQEQGLAYSVATGRHADYYSGSFGIQFSQLMFVRFAADLDSERAERYRQQAREFGTNFWRFFDSQGAVIPFGRSLIYRFACGAYFSALALADIHEMPEPLQTPGAIRGFLLRHLRWWSRHSQDIFNTDGTLNLGWIYPNMYMTEDYNSPQSPYWCLKIFVVLALDRDHAFWQAIETEYPLPQLEMGYKVLTGPQQLLCNHPAGHHHFLLSNSQFLGVNFKAAIAKYSKFAYSSAFGFSVPSGNLSLAQIGPDNTLVLSRDGTQSWVSKSRGGVATFGKVTVKGSQPEELITATVEWYPWVDRSLLVQTTLIPPCSRWPDWHVRIHRFKAERSLQRIFLAEGGFAIAGRQQSSGRDLAIVDLSAIARHKLPLLEEGIFLYDNGVHIVSAAGSSGLHTTVLHAGPEIKSSVQALKPEANTNLMAQRTLIPLVEHVVTNFEAGDVLYLVTCIFASVETQSNTTADRSAEIIEHWIDHPQVRIREHKGKDRTSDYILCPTFPGNVSY